MLIFMETYSPQTFAQTFEFTEKLYTSKKVQFDYNKKIHLPQSKKN